MNLPCFTLLALTLSAALAHAAPVSEAGRSCHLPGSEDALRCVTVTVPLDYAQPGGATLALHVTVAPAFRDAARPDPLFILAGGPGEAGSDVLPLLAATFGKTRATRDIVFIDQRGTGLSGKLDCERRDGDELLGEAEAERAARACLGAQKQPLAAYTTANAARDLDRVRLALGYGKVNLWGGSYGTRLAQAYARAFPAQVRALILDSVAAPEQVIPAGGRDAQAALDGLFSLCAANAGCAKAFPELRAEFAGLVERLGRGPIEINIVNPRTAEPLRVQMSSNRFLGTVHSILYSPLDSSRLPFLIHSAYQGRWQPFMARSNLASDISVDGGLGFVLHLAVTCAEDYPRLTPDLLAEDTRGSFLTAAAIRQRADLCTAVKVPAVPYAAPTPIAAPALLLSGALDPVTPPRRAEAAARHMPRAQHVVVANVGHGVSQLGCAPRLLRAFLDRPEQPLDAQCLKEIPAPTFLLRSAGPQP
ncbi:alpha/beta fold hydrolase [Janthinobacterium fluminis]|uniref:Alpha/beta fold hydrolase n=1 Tax=Janthinobacterium fluminis TaxID=2987524 RepID=A0ABT5K3A6_9BURK|nr:alpha/beta fold hydrolase [Janthinobacterium fluminis]MDC8759165.1 alpha/beta fold hydrolase [Janthinobacterium fluminis]